MANWKRKIARNAKPACAICGRPTRFKGKEIGWKCYNIHCDARRINKGGVA